MSRFSEASFLLVIVLMALIVFARWKLKPLFVLILLGMLTWMFYPMYQDFSRQNPVAEKKEPEVVPVRTRESSTVQPAVMVTVPKKQRVLRIYYRPHDPHNTTISPDQFTDKPNRCSDKILETTEEDGTVSYTIVPPPFCFQG